MLLYQTFSLMHSAELTSLGGVKGQYVREIASLMAGLSKYLLTMLVVFTCEFWQHFLVRWLPANMLLQELRRGFFQAGQSLKG